MASLEIVNNWTAEILNGGSFTGKQGALADAIDTAFAITVTGPSLIRPGIIATATWNKIWDDDTDYPTHWDYFWFWGDQACFLQIIGATTNFAIPLVAKVPIVLSNDEFFTAANTTLLSAAPTLEEIDSINLGNHSGSSMNYLAAFFD